MKVIKFVRIPKLLTLTTKDGAVLRFVEVDEGSWLGIEWEWGVLPDIGSVKTFITCQFGVNTRPILCSTRFFELMTQAPEGPMSGSYEITDPWRVAMYNYTGASLAAALAADPIPWGESESDTLICPVCGVEDNHLGTPKKIPGNDGYDADWGGRGDLIVIPVQGECSCIWELCFGFHKGKVAAFTRVVKSCQGSDSEFQPDWDGTSA